MAKLEAVLFDFDSTLVHTEHLREFRDSGRFAEISEEHIGKTFKYRPVVSILKRLRDAGIKTGVVTNSPRKYINRLLSHHEVGHLLDVVICYDDVGPTGKKPSPNGIALALEQLGITKTKRVAYIGDEYTDIEAAYRAGVIPVVPSWASRSSVSTPPAAELSSASLIEMAFDIEGAFLFAERCAFHKGTDFDRTSARFLPLDDEANVVTIRHKLKTFCLGRYFSQMNEVTAKLHDSHPLSLEIVKKDKDKEYTPPRWMAEMLLKISKSAGLFLFEDQNPIDLVTVIPQKPGKHPRLETLLNEMRQIAAEAGISIEFRSDLLYFDTGAANSLRGLKADARRSEQEQHLHVNHVSLAGRRALVIDDVITTGSTIRRAMSLLDSLGCHSVHGLGVAKTVHINQDAKPCPECGRTMLIMKNRKTGERFWSCSGYFDNKSCIHAEPVDLIPCPKCGEPLSVRIRKSDQSAFYGCTSFPKCNYTRSK